jgi:ABC-2 type transport system permease protein
MRKVWVIAAREYLAAVKTKSFLIGIVLFPIMMSGGIVGQALFKDQIDRGPKQFAVVDRTAGQQFLSLLETEARQHNEKEAASARPTFVLEAVPPPRGENLAQFRLDLSERVRRGDLTGFLEIGPDVIKPLGTAALPGVSHADGLPPTGTPHPALDLQAVRYQTNRPFYRDFPRWAELLINKAVRDRRAEQHGVAKADLVAITAPVPLLSKGLATRDPRTGGIDEGQDLNPVVAILVPGGLVVLMFMMVLLGATPLMQGVTEEKMQRIAEVLLGSVQPFPLMMGKVLGMAGVSLTMASIYLGGAFWAVSHYGYGEYLPPSTIAWFLLYQVLALFLFGSLYAAVGAACTDMKESQAMQMPLTLVIMLPLFLWVNVVMEPTSTFATAISLFPLATPMLMVGRLAVPPGVPVWQPILGAVLVLATTVVCIYAAGRVFRVGLLLQGKGAKFSDLWRWVIRG